MIKNHPRLINLKALRFLHKITEVKGRNYYPKHLHDSAGKTFSLWELAHCLSKCIPKFKPNFKILQ